MTPDIKQRLLNNWGDKASAMACYAEVKLWDRRSGWAVYIMAMNPEEEDEVYGILHTDRIEVGAYTMKELGASYNTYGEYPVLDPDYRRRWASELFKQLNEETP